MPWKEDAMAGALVASQMPTRGNADAGGVASPMQRVLGDACTLPSWLTSFTSLWHERKTDVYAI